MARWVALSEAETMARLVVGKDWRLVREEESERERGWDRERGERRVERKVEADGRETDMWEEREKIKYIIERREKNNKFFFFGLAFVFVPFQIWNDIVHSC